MRGIRSGRALVTVIIVGAVVAACGPAASSSPTVSGAPASAPPAAAPAPSAATSPVASGAGLVLKRTESIGCDAIGVDYTSATIKIDAASDPAVSAVTNTGKTITVAWTNGFTATDDSAPVIRGPKGEEVARDGTKIDIPAGAQPRLAGYFVCVGPDAIYVLETDPQ